MYKAQFRDDPVAVKVYPIGNRAKGEVSGSPRHSKQVFLPAPQPYRALRRNFDYLHVNRMLGSHCRAIAFFLSAGLHISDVTSLRRSFALVQESFRKEIAVLRKCNHEHIVGFRYVVCLECTCCCLSTVPKAPCRTARSPTEAAAPRLAWGSCQLLGPVQLA